MIVDAQFIYTGGLYTEFRGYVFANGKPARIRDGATLEALLHRPDFKRVDHEEEGKDAHADEGQNAAEEVLDVLASARPVLHVPAKRGWPLGRPRK